MPMFASSNDIGAAAPGAEEWSIKTAEKTKYDQIFDGLNPENGKLSGQKVRPVLINSGLPANVLGKIWDLADLDKDGQLDRDEMAVVSRKNFQY